MPDRAARPRVAGLYAVTPDTADTPWLTAAVAAAVRGGAGTVQYRNKSASVALRHRQAAALAALLRDTPAQLIVNDDPALCLEVAAAGVHLGEVDGSIVDARACVGPDAVIGVSCYNVLGLARAAAAAGADYVAFGSFYASTVKPDARRADAALLREARALHLPIVAIGGITAEHAPALRAAGADAIAVISALFSAGDEQAIEAAARVLSAAFGVQGQSS
ncbi:MAG: thiamine phosphate synthase [Casimicrobiaceae bacterium]